jgi:hypothetical protein
MGSIHLLLDVLPHDTLVRLSKLRELPARSDEARRTRLTRSYRGDTKSLLGELKHQELAGLLTRDFLADTEETYRLKSPTQYNTESLREIASLVFIQDQLTSSFEVVSHGAKPQIPQADNLSRLAQLVGLLSGNVSTATQLAKKLSISERQVLYYIQAASFLELINSDHSITSNGDKLTKSKNKSNFIIDMFLKTSFVKKELTPIAIKSEIEAKKLTKAIEKMGYSTVTANRRAQTLLSWFRQAEADLTKSIREGRSVSKESSS